MEDEYRCVVYESRKTGARFMTPYRKGTKYEDNEHHILVEADVSEETGKLLCRERRLNTAVSFLDSLPSELRDPEMDAFLAGMILNEE